MISLDLKQTYQPSLLILNKTKAKMEFFAPLSDGSKCLFRVILSPHSDEFLPDVHNLAMGPPNDSGGVYDNVRLQHANSSKLFSTVMLFVRIFLTEHPQLAVGLDGSDELRAMLYHSMFVHNRNGLGSAFIIIGVDWYVRLLRNGNIEVRDDGGAFFKPRQESFDYERKRQDLYRYYMLKRKNRVVSN